MMETSARRQAVSAALWAAAGQGAAAVGILLGLSWLTGLLDPLQFGSLALALAVASLAGRVLLDPVAIAGAHHAGLADDRHELRELLLAVRHLAFRRALLATIIGLTTAAFFWLVQDLQLALIAVSTTAFVVFHGATVVIEHVLVSRRFQRRVAVHRGAQPVLQYAMAIVVVRMAGPSAGTAMVGVAAGAWATLVSELLVIERTLTSRLDGHWSAAGVATWIDTLRKHARPHQRAGVARWLESSPDRLVLAATAGVYQAGLYALAYQVGYAPIVALAGFITGTAEPLIHEATGEGREEELQFRRRVFLWFASACCAAAIATTLFHRQIFELLFQRAYWSGSVLVPVLAVAGSLIGLRQIESVRMPTRSNDDINVPPAITLAGLGLIAGGALVGGPTGAAAGQVLCALTMLVWRWSWR